MTWKVYISSKSLIWRHFKQLFDYHAARSEEDVIKVGTAALTKHGVLRMGLFHDSGPFDAVLRTGSVKRPQIVPILVVLVSILHVVVAVGRPESVRHVAKHQLLSLHVLLVDHVEQLHALVSFVSLACAETRLTLGIILFVKDVALVMHQVNQTAGRS